MFEIKIIRSGDGETKSLGTVDTLDAGKALVYALDKRYVEWEKSGFPELPDCDVLNYYEGCDVSATNLETGTLLYLEGTEDEDIWYEPEQ